jgi:hypothetical protein
MSKRIDTDLGTERDGTSQRDRRLAALAPESVRIDERTSKDLLAFVREFSEQVRFFHSGDDGPESAGSWAAFAQREDISLDDIVAYVENPSRFSGEKARWLGRPHFGLLLAFVELMGHARDQLNGLTRRHLDYYYRDVLQMELRAAVADRVAVLFGLGPRAARVRLPAGTELRAGRDSAGRPRTYLTEREVVVNRASVRSLKSVFVDRRITGLADVRRNDDLTAPEVLDQMLGLALGRPRPGDPIPPWQGGAIDTAFLARLRSDLAFARRNAFLEHHELRAMMRLVRRRESADAEWAEINRLLGVVAPANPRDFEANLRSRVGELHFEDDGYPEIESIDDLYRHRRDPATATHPSVEDYISTLLQALGDGDGSLAYERFVALMPIKLRIDAEWAEINRLLSRAGTRRRGVLRWVLEPRDPTAFAQNLAAAIGRVPRWPFGARTIADYDSNLRSLEAHLSTTAERLEVLAAFTTSIAGQPDARRHDWRSVDRILTDAHREQLHAARRAKLAEVRGGRDDVAALEEVTNFVLGSPSPALSWPDALARLREYLEPAQIALLSGFRDRLGDPAAPAVFEWSDAFRLLELAQTRLQQIREPVAEKIEWHNLYGYEDATAVLADPERSTRWRTFGPGPRSNAERGATVGWSLQSPLLSLSEGSRTVTLTFGLGTDGFDRPALLASLGLPAEPPPSPDDIVAALGRALEIAVTTEKGWSPLPLVGAKIASGSPGDDYWSIRDLAREVDEDRPAIQLVVRASVGDPAFAPLADSNEPWPSLRVSFAQRWDDLAKEWTTRFGAFEPFTLVAAHVFVDVDGLARLELQHEDRVLDPKKPFEPFGSRPTVGSRLLVSHPELVRVPLDSIRFDLEWMGLPDSIARHYKNYPGMDGAAKLTTRVLLSERRTELVLATSALLEDGTETPPPTKPKRRVEIPDMGSVFEQLHLEFPYRRRLDADSTDDLSSRERHFVWELGPMDFGHTQYAALAAQKARELAIAIATTDGDPAPNPEDYRVDPPYTPTIKTLRVGYTTSAEVFPSAPPGDLLLHVHPFGTSRIDPDDATLVPRYASAGELYIGLADVDPPQNVTLLLQLAEGTSDPDAERSAIEWSRLDGDRWASLSPSSIVLDETRGLINSGIVEVALSERSRGTRLPPGLDWVRIASARNTRSVCDTVGIHAQAVTARFDDRGNAKDHYDEPLAPMSIDRLAEPELGIALVEQRYSSFGAKAGEAADTFHTRVSERLRHKRRAISPWDYERLVLDEFPQIFKAKCLPARNTTEPGAWSELGKVELIVIPDIKKLLPSDVFSPKAPANLLADIEGFVSARAPGSARVEVRNARYVAVLVRLGVRFRKGLDEGNARERLQQDLVRFLSPWAFDEGTDVAIGGKIYANSIVDFVDRRDYVDFVAEIRLFRSVDQDDFVLAPPSTDDYHVATSRPDEVLVSAPRHLIEVISEDGYQASSFTGINYMRIELDFIVG